MAGMLEWGMTGKETGKWRQEGEMKKGGSCEGRATLGMRELPALHHVGGRNNRSGGGNKETGRQQGREDKRGHWGRTQKSAKIIEGH
jgi:hypothetical protein